MAREHGRQLDRRVMRTFKRMQEALGLWHDFVVVTEWAMRASLDGLLAHHDTKLQADVLALARLDVVARGATPQEVRTLWAKEGPRLTETIRCTSRSRRLPQWPPSARAAESEPLAAPVSRLS